MFDPHGCSHGASLMWSIRDAGSKNNFLESYQRRVFSGSVYDDYRIRDTVNWATSLIYYTWFFFRPWLLQQFFWFFSFLPFLPAVRSGAADGGGAPARVVPTVDRWCCRRPPTRPLLRSISTGAGGHPRESSALLRSVQSPRPPIRQYRRGTNLPPATHSSSGCPASASRPPVVLCVKAAASCSKLSVDQWDRIRSKWGIAAASKQSAGIARSKRESGRQQQVWPVRIIIPRWVTCFLIDILG